MYSKGERGHGYDRWTTEETFRLIRARINLEEEFSKKTFDLRQAWERVAVEAQLDKSYDKVKKKWYNLIAKYKQIKEPSTGVSTEDGCELSTTWIFYMELDEYLSKKHNINPPFLINSENGENIDFLDEEFDTTSSPLDVPTPPTAGPSRQIRPMSDTPSTSLVRIMERKRKLSEIEKDTAKTNKSIRKGVKLFETFMRQQFNLSVESSDSE